MTVSPRYTVAVVSRLVGRCETRSLASTTTSSWWKSYRGCTTPTRSLGIAGCGSSWVSFSTTTPVMDTLQHRQQHVRILYASQTGTAQSFANELHAAIQDQFPADTPASITSIDVTVQSFQQAARELGGDPSKILLNTSQTGKEDDERKQPTLNILLTSCSGVGEPPDNGRDFYQYLMQQQQQAPSPNAGSFHYSVFGLGNKVAHTKYYNVIGKNIDKQLADMGCTRVLPLALGDDGDCIEDDFDTYVEQILDVIRDRCNPTNNESMSSSPVGADDAHKDDPHYDDSPAEAKITLDVQVDAVADGTNKVPPPIERTAPHRNFVPCHDKITLRKDGKRLGSEKYPPLNLQPPESDVVRRDLFHLQGTDQQYYADGTQKFQVRSNQSLAPKAGETAIHEMALSVVGTNGTTDNQAMTPSNAHINYVTGDHLVMYPRNSRVIVEAYLQLLDVHPHAIIQSSSQSTPQQDDSSKKSTPSSSPSTATSSSSSSSVPYPYPTGLTVFETLLHCVDLTAPPSPSFSRMLLGRKNIDYRSEIAKPRRTVIDLLLETYPPTDDQVTGPADGGESHQEALISLEDLLYNLTPMKARYYSISSSNIARPDEILLAYRPIKYITTRGALREGLCTSYMINQAAAASGSGRTVQTSSIPAFINPNPSFRLPKDPQAPLLLIAGGCGIAPIRAFVEERLAMKKQNPNINFGQCKLYTGFRSPEDEVYAFLREEALQAGAVTEAKETYNFGCTDPSQRCMMVTDLLRQESADVWNHLDSGGYVIICGAGRTLGAAVEAAMMDLLQEHGGMAWDEAEMYMRRMVDEGRLLEDLAD